MGVTGANGFPCCTKESVDIVDTQIDINQHQLQLAQREDELENKLLELEPPREVDLEIDTELEEEAVPPLEWCLAPMLKPEDNLDSNLEASNEDLEEERYRVETVHPYTEELLQQDTHQWNGRWDSSYPSLVEEEQAAIAHHSIQVQTSKHLFWADKLIQASEGSLQRETNALLDKKSKDNTISHLNQEAVVPKDAPGFEKLTISPLNQEAVPKDALCFEKPLQNPSTQPELPDTGSEQRLSTHSSSSLPPAISLQDLVNLATSLAIASSSKMDLPTMDHRMKTTNQKAEEPSPAPPPVVESATPPAKKGPAQEKLSELLQKPPQKPLEARESEKDFRQKDKNEFLPYLDLSKPGPQKAIIEGKVKFLPTPVMSSQLTGDSKDSEPGNKKGSPLLLKIHFKLSTPSSPEK